MTDKFYSTTNSDFKTLDIVEEFGVVATLIQAHHEGVYVDVLKEKCKEKYPDCNAYTDYRIARKTDSKSIFSVNAVRVEPKNS